MLSQQTRIAIPLALALSTLSLLTAQSPAPENAGMAPYPRNYTQNAGLPSPADVSFLLDAPAGKHGFIGIRDGHFATADGQRIRFWGVNITDWSPGSRQIPNPADAAFWAATLARYGVNCVRFQFLDLRAPRGLISTKTADTQSFDPAQLDREDRFIAELEKRGIYIDFNLLVGRPFSTADGVHDADTLHEGAKGTSLFDTRLIELQRGYARDLLTHRNPYTGMRYTQDPAVALVEINNEDALEVGYRPPSPFYRDELVALYNGWLTRNRTPEQLARIRAAAGVAPGSPVPLMSRPHEDASAPPIRFDAEAEFYDSTQRSYFNSMEQYVKAELGSRSLVIATADHNHAGSGYPMLLATSSMDVVDGHDYWQHPEVEYVRKSPMVDDPRNSTVVELSRTAVAGKPYTVSEVNTPFPNDYAGEGIPILAAYGALQDWDAILWYTFEPKQQRDAPPYVGDPFDILMDPVKMPELALGALMFLRGDVQKARITEERSYTRQQVFNSMLLPAMGQRPYFTPGFPLTLPLEHEVRIRSLDGAPTAAFPPQTAGSAIPSDTGELTWYTPPTRNGLVTVNTPRTQAFIGYVQDHAQPLANLSAQVRNPFCTLLLSSLDNAPIARATRLLLVAGGPVENTGQVWNPAGTATTTWGQAPTRIDAVTGTLTLRGLAGARIVTVQPLDGAGQPLGTSYPAIHRGNAWQLTLGSPATPWYQLQVAR